MFIHVAGKHSILLMTLTEQKIAELGEELFRAEREVRQIKPLTDTVDGITIEDAYHISKVILDKRLDAGEVVVGKKIGVTSKVVQDMLNVDQPDFGFLTDKMVCSANEPMKISNRLIQPKAEGEIAFVLKSDLKGPNVTAQDVIDATDYISPCFEIVDSRINDWQIKIVDTVADNASCGLYIISDDRADPRGLDLASLHMKVFKNGEFLSEGFGSAVQGNPAQAVAWLANTLGEFGIPFLAGEVILSGSLVPLEPISAGDQMNLEIENLGSLSVDFS